MQPATAGGGGGGGMASVLKAVQQVMMWDLLIEIISMRT